MNNILVSINCITYNQEDYIGEAIEGFLKQKTTFKYEILIHDDASTDNTKVIIEEYRSKYPNIIKPMYQKQNQYSKGKRIMNFNIDRAVGKYIAFCEGDDYWIDPYKLQKQVDFMRENTEYSMCAHVTRIYNVQTQSIVGEISNPLGSQQLNLDVLVKGVAFHTSSLIIDREKMLDENGDISYPKFYLNAPVGDYALQLYMFTLGKVYYIDEVMSHYNWNVEGSWTKSNLDRIENKNRLIYRIIDMLNEFNEETKYIYDEFVKKSILYNEEQLYLQVDKLVNIKEVLKNNELINKNIYIFGVGAFGQSINNILLDNSIRIKGYIDNDKLKVGTEFTDVKVHSLEMIKKDSVILICSQWHNEIEKQLILNGYENYHKLISWQM